MKRPPFPCPLASPAPPYAGNTQMAVLLGLYDSNNYCWRSMTSPGITGLFNPSCLQAGDENLMRCYPGDNTYTLENTNTLSLIDETNQFHSLTTTTSLNGEAHPHPSPSCLQNRLLYVVIHFCLQRRKTTLRLVVARYWLHARCTAKRVYHVAYARGKPCLRFSRSLVT